MKPGLVTSARLAAALLALASLGLPTSCADPGPRIERLDLQDLPAPSMFQEIAGTLRRPSVLELPPRSVDVRFDLLLENVSLDEALDAVVEKDPDFQHGAHQEVLILWPAVKAELETSPFSREMPAFHAEGGAGEVLRLVLVEAGLADTTNLIVNRAGLRRPVTLDLRGATVRDAFLEIARQAHLAFVIEPGMVNVSPAQE